MRLGLARWAAAFALTQVVEMPIYLRGLPPGPRARRWGVAFGASALTHPIVWFVVPRLWIGHSYVAMAIAAETFAVLAEALWIRRFGAPRPLTTSFVANAASVAVGLAVRRVFGWP